MSAVAHADPSKPNPATPSAGLVASLRIAAADIKLAHSVFALPFAVLGAFLAAAGAGGEVAWPRFAGQLALVVVCMVFARTWAMLINRLADREFDAKNPRTSRRALASGRLSGRRGWSLAIGSALLFCAGAVAFLPLFGNPWPAYLCVPVLIWIAFYSYTKRFTALCHIFLGGALAASPLAAAIAVRPEALAEVWAVWWIAAFVLCWVAGFDVIYALQDEDFDRGEGLSSIPAALGTRGAIWASRVLHAAAAVALVGAARSDPRLGWAFGAAAALAVGLLVFEHAVVARRGKAGIPMAFFTVNGFLSVLLGLAGCVDVVA